MAAVFAFGIFGLIWLGVMVGLIILSGFGLYRMAQHAGAPSPWMAFVPVASSYLTGLLAERSLYCCTGRRLRLALWTPALQGIGTCGALMVVGLALADADFSGLVVAALVLTLVGWVAGTVFSLYTVLSILFGFQFIFLLIEMNTVPVSVAGPGPFPYGRPKYDARHQWSPAPAPGYGYPQGYSQPQNGGQGYSGQGPQFYQNGGYSQPQSPAPPQGPSGGQQGFYQNGGYSQPQPPAPPQGPSGGQQGFYQGSGYYQPPAPPASPRDEGKGQNGPEL